MKVRWLVAAGAVFLLSAVIVKADIVITFTRQAGTGPNAGQDIIRYFAAFSPSSFLGRPDDPGTPGREGWGATGLQSVSAQMHAVQIDPQPGQSFKFRFTDENGDGILDADIDSSTVATRTTAASNGTLGTHIRIGPTGAGAWTPVLVEPSGDTSVTDPVSGEPVGPQPEQNYGNVKQFRVEGANPNSPDLAARTANTGQVGAGALFAVAVVPSGGLVRIAGQIAADQGPIEDFHIDIPEPAGLGALGMFGLSLMGRRSKRSRVRG